MNLSSFFGGNKKSSGLFIPYKSEFKELKDEIPVKSINGVSEHLGYHTDQVYTFHEGEESDSGIINIVVEIFSSNIVFVLTNNTVTKLNNKTVNNYLRNFSVRNVFNSYTTEDILKEGIQNKSLKIDFLTRLLAIEEPEEDGMYYVELLGLYLYFIDGYLVNFQSSDGLNEWAKLLRDKNKTIFSSYEKAAKLYWGNEIGKVIDEINMQANLWAKAPDGMRNEYVDLHETEFGTINFAMLLVCHYNYELSFSDFLTINHGRYKEIGLNKFRVGRFIYEFSDEGILSNSYLSE